MCGGSITPPRRPGNKDRPGPPEAGRRDGRGRRQAPANGQEGLAALEREWIDLIFADINMPVMNGEEMIERIRQVESWRDLPIIIVSTEGSQTRIERLLRRDTRFIHKPFTPEVVRDVVMQMTGVLDEQPQ